MQSNLIKTLLFDDDDVKASFFDFCLVYSQLYCVRIATKSLLTVAILLISLPFFRANVVYSLTTSCLLVCCKITSIVVVDTFYLMTKVDSSIGI